MKTSTYHNASGSTSLIPIAKNVCYELFFDELRNRIYYSIIGYWKNEECVPGFVDDWEKALSLADPGFTLLIDMRTMITHPPQLKVLHEVVQRKIKTAGVKKVANIMPTDKIASLQVAAIAVKTDLPFKNFDSPAEAEQWLAQTTE